MKGRRRLPRNHPKRITWADKHARQERRRAFWRAVWALLAYGRRPNMGKSHNSG